MKPIHLAILGESALSAPLLNNGAPLGRFRLVREGADAVLIDLPARQRPEAATAALRAGQSVLFPPTALRAAELAALHEAAREGGGVLLPAGEIAHCEAGRRGIAAIAAPGFGTLRSLFLSIRQPRDRAGDVLEDLLPEALDAVLAIVPDVFTSVRLNQGALFGGIRDTAVILLRTAGDAVFTIELSRCLPPTIPAPGLGEVEIDAMGSAQSVRITPDAGSIRVHRDDGSAAIPWLDAPVLGMLRTLEAAVDDPAGAPEGLLRAARAMELTARIMALAADQAAATS